MKADVTPPDQKLSDSLGLDPPRWRVWLTRTAIFSGMFFVLVTVLSTLSIIVEKFFITLYVD